MHVDKILLTHNRLDHKSQILCNRVTVTLPNNLTRILHGELDLEILVPVGVDLQSSFTDPFGIIFIDTLYLETMRDVVFFQSCQD